MPTDSRGLSEPPEGAIVGENVPRENDAENVKDSRIERMKGTLRSRGRPYINMTESELQEAAIKKLEKAEVI